METGYLLSPSVDTIDAKFSICNLQSISQAGRRRFEYNLQSWAVLHRAAPVPPPADHANWAAWFHHARLDEHSIQSRAVRSRGNRAESGGGLPEAPGGNGDLWHRARPGSYQELAIAIGGRICAEHLDIPIRRLGRDRCRKAEPSSVLNQHVRWRASFPPIRWAIEVPINIYPLLFTPHVCLNGLHS